jgi:hypothetical protein
MAEMSRERLLAIVRTVWEDRDPVPDGLIERMQSVAEMAEIEAGLDLELELMTLVDRSFELAGARGTASYTLRYVHGDTDLLLRVAANGDHSRVDGWVVPPEPMTIRALRDDPDNRATVVSDTGRFEITDLPLGLVRLRLEPHDATRPPFATPTFEI